VDIDIKGFFDSIDHELLLRAVRKHTSGLPAFRHELNATP
jgi:retron-type reverse transcriptase